MGGKVKKTVSFKKQISKKVEKYIKTQEDILSYAEKHDLLGVMTTMMKEAYMAKTKEPYAFMAQYLMELADKSSNTMLLKHEPFNTLLKEIEEKDSIINLRKTENECLKVEKEKLKCKIESVRARIQSREKKEVAKSTSDDAQKDEMNTMPQEATKPNEDTSFSHAGDEEPVNICEPTNADLQTDQKESKEELDNFEPDYETCNSQD